MIDPGHKTGPTAWDRYMIETLSLADPLQAEAFESLFRREYRGVMAARSSAWLRRDI